MERACHGNQSVGLAGVASQDGMLYVAGGVSSEDRSDSTDRLLRYDPVNDTWTQLADMNNRRHSFELVSFRGNSSPTEALPCSLTRRPTPL